MAVLLFGCQTGGSGTHAAPQQVGEQGQDFIDSHPQELRSAARDLWLAAAEDRVLYEMELASQAMTHGYWDLAARRFDNVLDRIEITHAGTEQAARARSLWYEEEDKEFKGEPYERAMAYYYRGILYLKEGDYDNARAVFNAAILQDAFAEEHQHRCDFALMFLMSAYASHLMGFEQGRDEDLAELKELRPDFREPDWDNSVLVVAETGKSPRKLGDGVGHYQMRILRGRDFDDRRARLIIGAQDYALYPTEDIAFQAMTRGGRPIDVILEGQVRFQRRTQSVATNLTETAETAMVAAPLFQDGASEVTAIAGGLSVIGATAAIVAQNVKPRADTRYWSSLPDSVHTTFIPRDQCGQPARLEFTTEEGALVAATETEIPDDAVIVWARNNDQ